MFGRALNTKKKALVIPGQKAYMSYFLTLNLLANESILINMYKNCKKEITTLLKSYFDVNRFRIEKKSRN